MNNCFQRVVNEVADMLNRQTEWVERFAGYANGISNNIQKIKDKKAMFHEWSPLCLYMNVGSAKGSLEFSLRYHGQNVAKLMVDDEDVILNAKNFADANKQYFECEEKIYTPCPWNSASASEFRSHFRKFPGRKGGGNCEHKVESMLLTELSKREGSKKSKELHNIRPVKIADVCRFQMPTAVSASEDEPCYSDGHIDILARVGKGRGTKLCIMELKDEYTAKEPPLKVLKQALAYATFIRALLRSKSGNMWWKIFGFSGPVPNRLVLLVACVMPFNTAGESDRSFANAEVAIQSDSFKLHYIYLSESNKKIETSLGQVS